MEYQEPELYGLKITNPIEEQKIMSLNKFITLSIVSWGLYPIWWIYKSWCFFQQKERSDIRPAARTIFTIFFLIPLFNRIQSFAKEKEYKHQYYSIALFIGLLVTNLLIYLPDPFWLISVLSFVFLIPPFQALNYAKLNSTDFKVIEQTSFNVKQTILIIIGTIFWILVLLGLMVE